MRMNEKALRIAVLDLYQGEPNQGMRCIRELLQQYEAMHGLACEIHEFDVRGKEELPDLTYDVYISTGGPGSPLEDPQSRWEGPYFRLMDKLAEHNLTGEEKKHVLFICHSFQLICRHYKLGNVCKRKSTSFGVFPVHLTPAGADEPVFEGLPDPFYAVDSRDYQVISPDKKKLARMGATILAIEKERPHVPLERAIMAIRFSPYFLGTQFHPEADAKGMSLHLQQPQRREQVIAEHGREKYDSMLEQLNDPDKIMLTQRLIIPRFLDMAVHACRAVLR